MLSEASRSTFTMLAVGTQDAPCVCESPTAKRVCKSDKRTRVEPSVDECEAVGGHLCTAVIVSV